MVKQREDGSRHEERTRTPRGGGNHFSGYFFRLHVGWDDHTHALLPWFNSASHSPQSVVWPKMRSTPFFAVFDSFLSCPFCCPLRKSILTLTCRFFSWSYSKEHVLFQDLFYTTPYVQTFVVTFRKNALVVQYGLYAFMLMILTHTKCLSLAFALLESFRDCLQFSLMDNKNYVFTIKTPRFLEHFWCSSKA